MRAIMSPTGAAVTRIRQDRMSQHLSIGVN